MMDRSGMFPLTHENSIVVYPTGFPMKASNGNLVLENGHPIMLYNLLDANHRLIRD
jgi:hypothetical protein